MSANKRGNIFGQGKPERPYEERDDPADVPQRATAAQLAARNPTTGRRLLREFHPLPFTLFHNSNSSASMSSRRFTSDGQCQTRRREEAFANTRAQGLSQSANFSAPQPGAFNFGASAPAPANGGANAFGGFGGNNAFGGGSTTNSFPPAQAATPSNTFSSSSFPAFGGSGQGTGTGFNPQPPSSTGFNFTAGGPNPFATASSAPATNGSTPAPAPSFGGSMFGNSQTQSNPFGGLGQNNTSSAAPSGGMFGTSSAAPSGGIFGTSSAAPSGGLFGTTSGAPNATTTSAPASTPFTFGSTSAATTSAPATSGIFSGFGSSTQTASPAQNNIFSGFGANAQKDEAPKQPDAPQTNTFGGFGSTAAQPNSTTETPKPNNIFGGLSTGAQSTPNATATAPASNLFNFGAAAQKPEGTTSSAPSTSLFGTSNSVTPSAPASAPASNPFANLPTAAAASSTPFKFGATSQAQDTTPAPSNNLFGGLKKPEEANSATTPETPKSNPFASLAKPATPPAATPAASGSGFSIFGTTQDKGAISASNDKDSATATLKAPEAPKSSLFQPFSTPQPAKTNDVEKSQGGLFSAAQPKTSSGMFSQTFQPETNNSSNLFSKPASGFPSFTPSATTSTEAPKPPSSSTSEQSNPFASLSTPSTGRPNLFSAAKEPAQASPAPALSNEAETPEMPKVPKVHVPKGWAAPGAVRAQSGDSLMKQITDLTAQLQLLNGKYLRQISELPPTADWSSISLWHYQHATDIKKKIDNAKKQRAVSRGVTGNESSLSTKRKASDDNDEVHEPVASKRARPVEAPASPTPQPSTSTPKPNPPATATSNMFAKAIGNKPATPSTASSSTNLFAPKTTEKPTAEPAKTTAPAPSFGFTPSASATNGTSSSSTSGFKPNFGSASSSASSSSGFKPNFGSAPASGGGFLAQFTKTAKTYEELAAERKKKAMEEDYDSDEETEEQWSARYDKAEEERLAEEKKKAAATPAFTFGAAAKPDAPAKPDAQPSGSTSPKANPFAGLMKPTSGASTPSLFTPKAVSPAPSTGSQSIFNVPGASPAPSSNIFGHLSSGPSSNNQDESDEDDTDQQEAVGSVEPSTPPKHNFGESEPESDGTQDQTKPKPSSKGSLLSRITRDNDSESEKENRGTSSTLATNGTTTPTNKPFQFFDFNAASKTAPPKSDTFAGDQTYKFGSPIKFGQAPATEKRDAPKFQFQPATPSGSELSTTPAKPPPSNIFNFAPSTGGSSLFAPSGANSIGSSVFSSRAATPLSEAGETSAASAAEDDEGEKHEQIDLSKLTEEEMSAYDIVFHTEVVLARHEVEKDGKKDWVSLAKGPLWILKDKETAKCSVRVRIPSGATPVNYQILPSLLAQVTGSSKKQVLAMKPAKEGGLQRVLFSVKTPEIAAEMAAKYTESVPS
ncbi:uncharacterized protein yc1106_06453 [Curvularia clavata]|uniref:Uncharacterized protein n=1 Tax=Curvularia clavata TaxID=95742 RepID=A0A9Q9DUV2_CURCL|nr:uncharacterized protein yc1106_06453 [Curvularia clavata]